MSEFFITFVTVGILTIWYSFNSKDYSYYTDIITSLFSCILFLIIAHNCFIGINFNYALSGEVSSEMYTFVPIGIICIGIAITSMVFFIVKILEINHKELEDL
jgi:hypothetical protein